MIADNEITFELLTVQKCFKDNFYDVPDYQREYVWEDREVRQLLEDIHDEFLSNPNKEYFIGSTVTLQKEENTFDLIDGQQRTTTLFLLLVAFKEIYTASGQSIESFSGCIRSTTVDIDGNDVVKNRLTLQYFESNDLVDAIVSGKNDYQPKSASGKRIQSALEILKEFIMSRYQNDSEGLRKFFAYCFKKVKFIQIETTDISRALKIFETINERGVGLNSMDLLKNLLFRQVKLSEFPRIKNEWEQVIRILEEKKEKPLRFLRYFIMSSYDTSNSKGNEIVREDEIYSWFAKNELKWNENKDYFKFLKGLKANAIQFTNFVNGTYEGMPHSGLENLSYLGGSAFRQHLILLLAGKNLSLEIFSHLCAQFEAVIFMYILTKENARNYEARFSSWAKLLRTVSDKRQYNSFLEATILKEYTDRKGDFLKAMSESSSKGMPNYRVKYILSKFANYIENERIGGGQKTSISHYMDSGYEIEHIAPNNPTDEERDLFGDYEDKKYMLGNLTLLEKTINTSIGRRSFNEIKAPAYLKSSVYLTKSLILLENLGANTGINRINSRLLQVEAWNEEAISRRQKMLTQLAGEIWKVELMK